MTRTRIHGNAGKGDSPRRRLVRYEQYAQNYDRIFGQGTDKMKNKISYTESANVIREFAARCDYYPDVALAKNIFHGTFVTQDNNDLAVTARSGRTYYSILSVIRRHRAKQAVAV